MSCWATMPVGVMFQNIREPSPLLADFQECLPRRAAKAALYHGESCSAFVSAAEELQAVLLSDRIAHLRPGFLLEYESILQEALCVFKCFSSRYICLNIC